MPALRPLRAPAAAFSTPASHLGAGRPGDRAGCCFEGAQKAMQARRGGPPGRPRGRRPRARAGAGAEGVDAGTVGLAHRLADAAGAVCREYWRAGVAVEAKGDESPVTVADRKAEAAMRALLAAEAPGHGVVGEEQGLEGGDREFVWVLDPIDGTKSFITGKPVFGTLIALCRRGTPVLGVLDQPITGERWVGRAGEPSTLNGAPIATRPCPALSDAYLYTTSPHLFSPATGPAFASLRDRIKTPLYGADCYAYGELNPRGGGGWAKPAPERPADTLVPPHQIPFLLLGFWGAGLLAAGCCDLVCESGLKPYDYMALIPIIEGAGGSVTDWEGRPLGWDPARGMAPGEVLASGDPGLHRQALATLAQAGGAG